MFGINKIRIGLLSGLLFVALLCCISLTGCGRDGDDGNAYIAINWLYDPFYYIDDNLDTPPNGYSGTYYRTEVGTYYFQYTAWDYSVWDGIYTITVNKGENGGITENGEDGEDRYFDLDCYSIGPNLYESAISTENEILEAEAMNADKAVIFKSDTTSKFNGFAIDPAVLNSPISDKATIVKKQGKYTMTLEYQRVR